MAQLCGTVRLTPMGADGPDVGDNDAQTVFDDFVKEEEADYAASCVGTPFQELLRQFSSDQDGVSEDGSVSGATGSGSQSPAPAITPKKTKPLTQAIQDDEGGSPSDHRRRSLQEVKDSDVKAKSSAKAAAKPRAKGAKVPSGNATAVAKLPAAHPGGGAGRPKKNLLATGEQILAEFAMADDRSTYFGEKAAVQIKSLGENNGTIFSAAC